MSTNAWQLRYAVENKCPNINSLHDKTCAALVHRRIQGGLRGLRPP